MNRIAYAVLAGTLLITTGCFKGSRIDFTNPADGATNVAPDTTIEITFTGDLDEELALMPGNYSVSGTVSGVHVVSVTYDSETRLLTLTSEGPVNNPDASPPFSSGEVVTVSLSDNIKNASGVPLDDASFSFTIAGSLALPQRPDPTPLPNSTNQAISPMVEVSFAGQPVTDASLNPPGGPVVYVTGSQSGSHVVTLTANTRPFTNPDSSGDGGGSDESGDDMSSGNDDRSDAQTSEDSGSTSSGSDPMTGSPIDQLPPEFQGLAGMAGGSDSGSGSGDSGGTNNGTTDESATESTTSAETTAAQTPIPDDTLVVDSFTLTNLGPFLNGETVTVQIGALEGVNQSGFIVPVDPYTFSFQIGSGEVANYFDFESLGLPTSERVSTRIGNFVRQRAGLEVGIVTNSTVHFIGNDFRVGASGPVVGTPVASAVADLNLDNQADLVVLSASGGITVYDFNNLQLVSTELVLNGQVSGAVDIEIADLDANGTLDFVIASSEGVFWMPEFFDADLGFFYDEPRLLFAPESGAVVDIALGDFYSGATSNHPLQPGPDAPPDLHATTTAAHHVYATLKYESVGGVETPQFAFVGSLSGFGDTFGRLQIADFTDDGQLDLIARTDSTDLLIYDNRNFSNQTTVWNPTLFGLSEGTTLVDFTVRDADGQAGTDLVTLDESGTVRVYGRRNGAELGSADTEIFTVGGASGAFGSSLFVGAILGDSGLDLLVVEDSGLIVAESFVTGAAASADFAVALQTETTAFTVGVDNFFTVEVIGTLSEPLSAYNIALDFDPNQLSVRDIRLPSALEPAANGVPSNDDPGVFTVTFDPDSPLETSSSLVLAEYDFEVLSTAPITQTIGIRTSATVDDFSTSFTRADQPTNPIVPTVQNGTVTVDIMTGTGVVDLTCEPRLGVGAGGTQTDRLALEWSFASGTNLDLVSQVEVVINGGAPQILNGAATQFTTQAQIGQINSCEVRAVVNGVLTESVFCEVFVVPAPILDSCATQNVSPDVTDPDPMDCDDSEREFAAFWTLASATPANFNFTGVEVLLDGELVQTVTTNSFITPLNCQGHLVAFVAVGELTDENGTMVGRSAPLECSVEDLDPTIVPPSGFTANAVNGRINLHWLNGQLYSELRLSRILVTDESEIPLIDENTPVDPDFGEVVLAPTATLFTDFPTVGTYVYRLEAFETGNSISGFAFSTAATVDGPVPPFGLVCNATTDVQGSLVRRVVQLTWSLETTYDSISILRNGEEIASGLDGAATEYLDLTPAQGEVEYRVVGIQAGAESTGNPTCTVTLRTRLIVPTLALTPGTSGIEVAIEADLVAPIQSFELQVEVQDSAFVVDEVIVDCGTSTSVEGSGVTIYTISCSNTVVSATLNGDRPALAILRGQIPDDANLSMGELAELISTQIRILDDEGEISLTDIDGTTIDLDGPDAPSGSIVDGRVDSFANAFVVVPQFDDGAIGVSPGETFYVDVSANYDRSLSGFAGVLSFDPAAFEILNSFLSPAITSSGTIDIPLVSDNDEGLVGYFFADTTGAALAFDLGSYPQETPLFSVQLRVRDDAAEGSYELGLTDTSQLSALNSSFEFARVSAFVSVSEADNPLTVASLVPASGPSSGGQLVTVTGTGFDAATAVSIGSDQPTIELVSTNEIRFTTPAGFPGTVPVSVTNAIETVSAGTFTYLEEGALELSIDNLSPALISPCQPSEVTITGVGFGESSQVQVLIGQEVATIVAGPTLIDSDTGVSEVTISTASLAPNTAWNVKIQVESESVTLTDGLAVGSAPDFLRGDINGDGVVDVTDLSLITRVINGTLSLPNFDAADVNDDGVITMSDRTALQEFLVGGEPPAAPFPHVGSDPTDDAIGCEI